MCGIAGIIRAGLPLSDADEAATVRMRYRLAHRGPDGAGLYSDAHAMLGHRRLAVIDPTPAGDQPMAAADGSAVLVYNGELYNDAEIRGDLEQKGAVFRTTCDTETVLEALRRWGRSGLERLRGMFALALWEPTSRRLTLARDPLGIKPLHFTVLDGCAIVFASEIPALFEHPRVSRRPDWTSALAYLRTGCTTWDDRTMFERVRTLRPGEVVTVDASGETLVIEHGAIRGDVPSTRGDVREATADSVRAHLRSDVPTCGLLSGGLDSTLISALIDRGRGGLRTYCAGARTDEPSEDFAFAREAAQALRTDHHEVPISREMFQARWTDLIAHNGAPLSTPNEVAIHEVSRWLRADGRVVALTGEGADELFAGYDAVLDAAWRWIERTPADANGGAHELEANAWFSREQADALLAPASPPAAEECALRAWYERVYDEAVGFEPKPDAPRRLRGHLGVHRRINLERLLRRLDSSTMAASVEGRTPFADVRIAELAGGLPLERLYRPPGAAEPRTKLALRAAARGIVPESIRSRPKASFPLPFRSWVGGHAKVLDGAWARAHFDDGLRTALRDRGREAWHLAWPAINLALWGEAWGE